ncbi:MAG: hypothetical protein CMM16_05175 [Rhodospirillaceae bacterium]|nr:hypothetical protein [Rhodospirillaceae bacterium]
MDCIPGLDTAGVVECDDEMRQHVAAKLSCVVQEIGFLSSNGHVIPQSIFDQARSDFTYPKLFTLIEWLQTCDSAPHPPKPPKTCAGDYRWKRVKSITVAEKRAVMGPN